MDLEGTTAIDDALDRVGQLLAARGLSYAIVVLGGAALNLLGILDRATTDVDILAFADPPQRRDRKATEPQRIHPPPEPMPSSLTDAARRVARELGLAENWLNTGPALQWRAGLPSGLERRVHWRRYSALWVGVVDRYDLIFFKLFAAADSTGPRSVHYRDLAALRPTAKELSEAAGWVRMQDASVEFATVLEQMLSYAREDLKIQ